MLSLPDIMTTILHSLVDYPQHQVDPCIVQCIWSLLKEVIMIDTIQVSVSAPTLNDSLVKFASNLLVYCTSI